LTLHAVYPPTQHLAVKVRLFIDFLVGRFSGVPARKSGQMIALGIDMERPLVAAKRSFAKPRRTIRFRGLILACGGGED
jgi:hypothetical protein